MLDADGYLIPASDSTGFIGVASDSHPVLVNQSSEEYLSVDGLAPPFKSGNYVRLHRAGEQCVVDLTAEVVIGTTLVITADGQFAPSSTDPAAMVVAKTTGQSNTVRRGTINKVFAVAKILPNSVG